MFTPDGRPPGRSNAHAHVDARVQFEVGFPAIIPMLVSGLPDRSAAARGANLTATKHTIAG